MMVMGRYEVIYADLARRFWPAAILLQCAGLRRRGF